MNDDFGLRQSDIDTIVLILSAYSKVKQAIQFGSRAKGNYRNGSDVDIAIKTEELSFEQLSEISVRLNEDTCLPYKFDVLIYETIVNAELLDHINRIGICFYKKT
jgi:predicted nucleotidyltransferase